MRHEFLDQTPVVLPVHFNRQEPLHIRIMRQVRQEMQDRMASVESADDAGDFGDLPSDDIEDHLTRYQDEDDFERRPRSRAADQRGETTQPATPPTPATPPKDKASETPRYPAWR